MWFDLILTFVALTPLMLTRPARMREPAAGSELRSEGMH